MQARARAAGHAMHPVLMVFPLGLLSTSVVFDVIYFVTDDGRYASAAFLMIAAGILGGLVAGAAGFLDWLKIPRGTRAKRIGAIHGIGNEVMLGIFAVSWLIRLSRDGDHAPIGCVDGHHPQPGNARARAEQLLAGASHALVWPEADGLRG